MTSLHAWSPYFHHLCVMEVLNWKHDDITSFSSLGPSHLKTNDRAQMEASQHHFTLLDSTSMFSRRVMASAEDGPSRPWQNVLYSYILPSCTFTLVLRLLLIVLVFEELI